MNIKNSLIYLVSNAYVALMPFLLMPFLLRVFSPQEYGIVGIFTSLVTLLTTLNGMALTSFLRNHLDPDKPINNILYVNSANFIVAVVGSILIIVASILALSEVKIAGIPPDLLFWAGGMSVCQALVQIKLVVWQLGANAKKFGAYLFLSTSAATGFTLYFVFALELGVHGRVYAMVLPILLAGIWCFVEFVRSFNKPLPTFYSFKVIFSYITPLLPHAIVLTGVTFAERVVAETVFGADALGYYVVAYQLAVPVLVLVNSLNLQFKVYSNDLMRRAKHRECVISSYFIMLIFAVAASCFGVLISFAYELVVGDNFLQGKRLVYLFIFAAFVKGVYLVVLKGLMFVGNTKTVMLVSVSTTAIYLALLPYSTSLEQLVLFHCLYHVALTIQIWFWANKALPQPWFKWFWASR